MFLLRKGLQLAEWNIETESGSRQTLSITGLGNEYGFVELTGEMSTAYGTALGSYDVEDPYNVEFYSFEFSSLVGSYPAREDKFRGGNREIATVGLAHSVVLAKHFGWRS